MGCWQAGVGIKSDQCDFRQCPAGRAGVGAAWLCVDQALVSNCPHRRPEHHCAKLTYFVEHQNGNLARWRGKLGCVPRPMPSPVSACWLALCCCCCAAPFSTLDPGSVDLPNNFSLYTPQHIATRFYADPRQRSSLQLDVLFAARLAPLSEGRLHNGHLACNYHGWEFDVKGNCLANPQVCSHHASSILSEYSLSGCTRCQHLSPDDFVSAPLHCLPHVKHRENW